LSRSSISQGNGTFVVKRRTSARLRKKNQRAKDLRRRQELEHRTTRWATSLDMTGSASGLLPAAGVPLLRLLAEESGLRAGLSKALTRNGFGPGHDRGQVVIDVAVALAHGATNLAAAVGVLHQARVVCGPTASTPTVWRVFDELDEAALARLAAARATQRRTVWATLAAREQGFPWVQVAGQTWDGWIVIDVDASLVESHSDKQGAAPTYKKHIYGLHPIVVSCANTSEVLAVLLGKGNAGSNTVADHVTVLTEAIGQLPARYRRKVIFRADGAAATKEFLAWITAEAATRGYTWHYSVGFDVTESVRTAITTVPARVWTPALTPEGEVRRRAHVTEITGLLTLADGWPLNMRILARTEPLHPKHRKQASQVEKQREQRFQVVATDLTRTPLPPPGRVPPQPRRRGNRHQRREKPRPETAPVLLPRLQPGLVPRRRDRRGHARLAAPTRRRPSPEAEQGHPRHPALHPAQRPRPTRPPRPPTPHPPTHRPPPPQRPHPRLAENPRPTHLNPTPHPHETKGPTRPRGKARAHPAINRALTTPETRNPYRYNDINQSLAQRLKIMKDLG
jgi:hypothetical protein